MGCVKISLSATVHLAGTMVLMFCLAGCQAGRPISNYRLIEHQALVDFSGLESTAQHNSLKVVCAAPRDWHVLPFQDTPLFAHQQWRSPSTNTGVGVALVHLPLPLSTEAVIWLAKHQYMQKSDDGKLIAEWTDGLGRHWFEGENRKYHIRGYAVTEGFSAWFVYFGYKINRPMHPGEISVASRSLETVVPMNGEAIPHAASATVDAAR